MTGAGAAWRMEAMCAALCVRVPRADHAAMAGRCAWCEMGELCRLWRLEGLVEPRRAPDFCLNAEAIGALAAAA